MSENIQSISQGTYTIGATSATNFIAGPGIKIDESSAGTLRIGNDETVLYSGAASYNTEISLSEPTSAFETVKFYWAGENGGNDNTFKVSEFSITDTRELCFDGLWKRYTNSKWNFGGFVLSANVDLTKYKMTHNYRYNLSGSLMDFSNDASNFAYVHKVVGINRKEV